MINRWIEQDGLLDALEAEGIGCIAFSPLAQGMLTDKYLAGIPGGQPRRRGNFARPRAVSMPANIERTRQLDAIAKRRGQTLAQMALAWVLRGKHVTSALIGASRPEQVAEGVAALNNAEFSTEELAEIDRYAVEGGVNLWARSSQTAPKS